MTHRLGKVGSQIDERPRKFHARFSATNIVTKHCMIYAHYMQCLNGYQRWLLEHWLQTKSRQSELIIVLALAFRSMSWQADVKGASQGEYTE
jgi:hypothetical protein